MNDDIYAEWLVQREKFKWLPLAYIGGAILGIVGFWLMINFKWGFVAFILVAFALFVGRRFLSVEYEYTFVTNELDIDRIFSKSSRRNAMNIQMSSVESVEPASDQKREQLISGGTTYKNFTSREDGASTYFIIFSNEDEGRTVVEFEPNEKVLNAMWRCSPSKVKR